MAQHFREPRRRAAQAQYFAAAAAAAAAARVLGGRGTSRNCLGRYRRSASTSSDVGLDGDVQEKVSENNR